MGKFKALFGGVQVPPPPPPPPAPPKRTDPEVTAAKEEQRKAELRRKGRRASILTGGQGVKDDLGQISRPEARGGARLLGE